MTGQLATADDYRGVVVKAVTARPERVWALARLALEVAAKLIPHLQPHAALLTPLNAHITAEYGGQIADASGVPEVRVIARWAGQAAALAHTIHAGASDDVGGDGMGMAELAAGIIQHVDACSELDSWARVLATALTDQTDHGDGALQ